MAAKKQGYNARLDESLGARNGKKSQPMKMRRKESKGAKKAAAGRRRDWPPRGGGEIMTNINNLSICGVEWSTQNTTELNTI